MNYCDFGKTGVQVSRLGLGAMRMPMIEKKGRKMVDEDKAMAVAHRAFELGVNYIDSAHVYLDGQCDGFVGRAVRAWKGGRIHVATKNPTWKLEKKGDYRRFLEEQLKNLGLGAIDFYHCHGLNGAQLDKVILGLGVIDEIHKAKEEGLIRHASFSFHDKPAVMKRIIDTGVFESVLCQYNILDQSNAKSIAYAARKGLGVVAMGPVGGGRLIPPEMRGEGTQKKAKEAKASAKEGARNAKKPKAETATATSAAKSPATPAQLALHYVLGNPGVHCALSGMSTVQMVEENAAAASEGWRVTKREIDRFAKAIDDAKALAKLYCTGCEYCLPCPAGVNIPRCFEALIYARVWKVPGTAKFIWNQVVQNKQGPSLCTECGECEDKCPQKIQIRKQLKETAEVMSSM